MSEAVAGRRTAAKIKVRTAIRQEALALFRADSFDAVTTQQIAARAGVTQRTLFRYYPTKAAILFDGIDEVATFERVVRREAATAQTPRDAVRDALRALAVDYDRRAREFREVYAIMSGCPMLHALERQRHGRIDEVLAQALDGEAALAGGATPSLGARIAAGTVMGFIRPVIRAWLRGEVATSMETLARRAWPVISQIIDHSLSFEAAARR